MIRIGTAEDIGETLSLLRALARLTQRTLAALAGTTQTQIGLWELGQVLPGLPNLVRLLAALGYQLALVPLDHDGPASPLSATLTADHPSAGALRCTGGAEGGSEGSQAVADSCTCSIVGPAADCPVHRGRRARGPKPPPVGPGCICDGSGRTCPRHGAVI
jgi:transcriptional regulator with XRE-family HTH domain